MLRGGTEQAGLLESHGVGKHVYSGPRSGCLRGICTQEPDASEASPYTSAIHNRAPSAQEYSDGISILLLPTSW